jgi:hypothetical protein
MREEIEDAFERFFKQKCRDAPVAAMEPASWEMTSTRANKPAQEKRTGSQERQEMQEQVPR